MTTAQIFGAALLIAGSLMAQAPPAQSPAAKPRPKAKDTETFPAVLVKAGETRFVSQCGFCHGRDASGGETGPDLTLSQLVADDVRGDKIAPVIRAGRPDAGMPSFRVGEDEMKAIVAFIHTQANKLAELGGGRRTVDPSDLATGNADDGRGYFNGAGGCAACHSPAGDLAGVATRYKGLALLQRMLYPTGRPAPAAPKATFTLESGQTVTAPVITEDEFSVTVLDPLGQRQKYTRDKVKVKIDDPLQAHFAALGKYTDADVHDVYAYLATLK
jgi:cytochrome c oxidase cbb3-type subunit III